MKKLFLDLDDVFVDTETYIRNILINELYSLGDKGSIYYLWRKEGYNRVFNDIFSNYDIIPLKECAEDCLNLLSTEFEVIFASCYYSEKEKKAKELFAKKYEKDIILCNVTADYKKSSIDMTGSIVVDDSIEVLSATKADVKVQMFNPYIAEGMPLKDYLCGDFIVENLSMVVDKLIGGKKNGSCEVVRGSIYQGIQTKYKNSGEQGYSEYSFT